MQARKRAKLLRNPEKLAAVRTQDREKKRTARLEAYWETLARMYAADPVRTRKSGVLQSDLAVQALRAVCANGGQPTRNRRRV